MEATENMKIIAHRCGTDRYPELTVAAARHSLAAGAAYVEMDVRFTFDGVPVIHHDDTADGLFGDPRRISEMTLPEFLALRHKSDPAFCSHTMEDFLRCGVRQILYMSSRAAHGWSRCWICAAVTGARNRSCSA